VVQGLSLFEKRGYHIIHLFQFRLGEGKPGTGFAPDLLVFLLRIGSFVKMFFQGTPAALLTAVADIGRLGKLRADILFIRGTGGSTLAARPAQSAGGEGTGMTGFLDRTLVEESMTAVVEGPSPSPGFLKTDMVFYFL